MTLATAMTVASTAHAAAAHGAGSAARWQLHGHDGDVLSACSRGSVFATCDAKGAVLVWRSGGGGGGGDGGSVENVCAMTTGGPAVLDVAFATATLMATAQGDGAVGVWDVEKGVRQRRVTRNAKAQRGNWPVVNAVTALDSAVCAYGGDDGYLVHCDTRAASPVTSAVALHTAITALCSTADTVVVGDACGEVRQFDRRLGTRPVVTVSCATDVIAGLACGMRETAVVACALDDTAVLLDLQPFALSEDERVVARTRIGHDDERGLRRCTWSYERDTVVVPCAAGALESLRVSELATCAHDTLAVARRDTSVRVAQFVHDDKYVVCGGSGGDVVLCEWP